MQRLITGFMPTETANASNSLEDIAPYQNCGIAKLLSVTPVSQAAHGILPCTSTSLSYKEYAISMLACVSRNKQYHVMTSSQC